MDKYQIIDAIDALAKQLAELSETGNDVAHTKGRDAHLQAFAWGRTSGLYEAATRVHRLYLLLNNE